MSKKKTAKTTKKKTKRRRTPVVDVLSEHAPALTLEQLELFNEVFHHVYAQPYVVGNEKTRKAFEIVGKIVQEFKEALQEEEDEEG